MGMEWDMGLDLDTIILITEVTIFTDNDRIGHS